MVRVEISCQSAEFIAMLFCEIIVRPSPDRDALVDPQKQVFSERMTGHYFMPLPDSPCLVGNSFWSESTKLIYLADVFQEHVPNMRVEVYEARLGRSRVLPVRFEDGRQHGVSGGECVGLIVHFLDLKAPVEMIDRKQVYN